MPQKAGDGWTGRRAAQEDEYFRNRDQELIEQAQLHAQDEAQLRDLAEATGVTDGDLLQILQTLGYTPETVTLLHVVPLLQVAWADGNVSGPEREVIIGAARSRGVVAGSPANLKLSEWLIHPPPDVLCDGTLHVLGSLTKSRPAGEREAVERGLLSSCATVASASGGVFGFRKVSGKEQQVLDRIGYELQRK
jgi:hypothetical protein